MKRPMNIKNPKGIWLRNPPQEVAQKKPYFVITAMLYLCEAIGAGNSYKKKVIALVKEHPQIPIYRLGFLDKWDEEPIWEEK